MAPTASKHPFITVQGLVTNDILPTSVAPQVASTQSSNFVFAPSRVGSQPSTDSICFRQVMPQATMGESVKLCPAWPKAMLESMPVVVEMAFISIFCWLGICYRGTVWRMQSVWEPLKGG